MDWKNKATFFYEIDKDILSDKQPYTNKYFTSISCIFVAIIAILVSGGDTLHSWFDWDIAPSLIAAVALCILIWGINVAESIVACKPMDALWRSIILTIMFPFIFLAAYWLTPVMMVLIAIELGILLLSGAADGLSEYNETHKEKEWELSNGEKIRGSLNPGGNSVHGTDGIDYPIK